MKYQIQQISYDCRTFQNIEECTWNFSTSEINTGKGLLKILGFQEVEQNSQVGVQMNVDGWLNLNEYYAFSPFDGPVYVRTLAIMRRPHNVWLWVYLFNDNGQPVAVFCGSEGINDTNSFAMYVKELKRMADGGVVDAIDDLVADDFPENITPSAEERVTGYILADGKKYNGWGYYHNQRFVPHGCGKKFYTDFNVYGNFNRGVLNGPAINSHSDYMYTMFFKENRGNGWGLCINGGFLVEFGYYENSRLKTDLLDFVQWYYEEILGKSGRTDEKMMTMYTSKETKEVSTLLIGYAPKIISDSITLSCVGFRFKIDGSVWVGTGNLSKMTGDYMHFRSDGCIDIGRFDDGILLERKPLQDLIDIYFGTYRISDDIPFTTSLRNSPGSSFQIGCESEREHYRNIKEPIIDFSYFTGDFNYSNDLPF